MCVQPQVMQLQQTVPVQVPVSANGQTIYQTVYFPLQALASNFNSPSQVQMIPQVSQVTKTAQLKPLFLFINIHGRKNPMAEKLKIEMSLD